MYEKLKETKVKGRRPMRLNVKSNNQNLKAWEFLKKEKPTNTSWFLKNSKTTINETNLLYKHLRIII